MSNNTRLLTLEEQNDEELRKILPAVVTVSVLMVVGLIGNPLVIYFYGFKVKRTASFVLITIVASFDLLICVVSMPLEIFDMVHFITFPNADACRLLRFISHFGVFGSGATLIAVAIDRFRKICRPFGQQISLRLIRYVVLTIVMFSLLNSCPALVFYTVVEVNITTGRGSVVGYDCTSRIDSDYRKYINVYNVYCFALFFVTITALFILYVIIARNLHRFKDRQSKRLSKLVLTKSYSDAEESMRIRYSSSKSSNKKKRSWRIKSGHPMNELLSDVSDSGQAKEPQTRRSILEHKFMSRALYEHSENTGSDDSHDLIEQPSNHRGSENNREPPVFRRQNSQSIPAKKFTIITLLISAVYVFNFLPYLTLMTWRTLQPEYTPNLLTDSELAAFQIGIRSFLLSSACNPIINGLLNSQFKDMLIMNLKKMCCFCCHD